MRILIVFLASMLVIQVEAFANDWLGAGTPNEIVKLYGEGGIAGVEAYQTGLLVSLNKEQSSEGLILTVDSPALGSGDVLTVFSNGHRLTAEFLASDPTTELALLKVDLQGDEIDCYRLAEHRDNLPAWGQTLYAVSNTFNIATGEEDMTVQRTLFSSLVELATSRLGSNELRRQVILLDAVTSNPGTAGGAVLDREGNLLGMIGKESRSNITGNWINYAIMPKVLYEATYRMTTNSSDDLVLAEDPALRIPGSLLDRFGACFVPTLADRSPPLIEYVSLGSQADQLGLVADDLVIFIDSQTVSSARQAEEILKSIVESQQPFQVTVLRDDRLIQLTTGKEVLE